jgi:hypothetical protein
MAETAFGPESWRAPAFPGTFSGDLAEDIPPGRRGIQVAPAFSVADLIRPGAIARTGGHRCWRGCAPDLGPRGDGRSPHERTGICLLRNQGIDRF